jgi:antitoxin ParD1/3/4
MNVSLPHVWEEFVAGQVTSGEFGNASEVVREGLRLLRDRQETRAFQTMRAAFENVDAHGGQSGPSPADRALIDQLVKRHRQSKRRS